MIWRSAMLCVGALCAAALGASSASAQVVVYGGAPAYGTAVVVGRPVVPAVSVVPAPVYASPYAAGYASPYAPAYVAPTYSASYGVYSTYRPVVPATYLAPAPVVTYSRAVVPVYPPVRTGVASTRVYYPGQPVRNTLRVLAP